MKQVTSFTDTKYDAEKPKIFCSSPTGASQFFKSLIWAAQAAKMGYRWKIGDGRQMRYWEDNLIGPSSLAIQYWDRYVIVNEKNKSVHELWDGNSLKCAFRRIVSHSLYRKWEEVLQLASTIAFTNERDEMIWIFNSNRVYSSQSLYRIIYWGVKPVHLPVVWNLKVSPKSPILSLATNTKQNPD